MTMHCLMCAKDIQPSIDINAAGQAIACCPVCQAPLGQGISATDQPVPEPREPSPISLGGPLVVPKGGKLAAPLDLVAEAKKRLDDIDRELERLDGLQRERRRLAAMVAAAESADSDQPVLLVRKGFADTVEPPTTIQAAE